VEWKQVIGFNERFFGHLLMPLLAEKEPFWEKRNYYWKLTNAAIELQPYPKRRWESPLLIQKLGSPYLFMKRGAWALQCTKGTN